MLPCGGGAGCCVAGAWVAGCCGRCWVCWPGSLPLDESDELDEPEPEPEPDELEPDELDEPEPDDEELGDWAAALSGNGIGGRLSRSAGMSGGGTGGCPLISNGPLALFNSAAQPPLPRVAPMKQLT